MINTKEEPKIICVKGDEDRKYLFKCPVSRKFAIENKDPKFMTKDDRISIISDSMFKTMLLTESRKKFSCKLLSYILNVDYEYLLEHLEFYKNVFDKSDNVRKNEVGDFVAKIGDTLISIEMNVNNSVERNAEYVDRLYASNVKMGDAKYNYYYVIQVNYNNYSFVGHEEVKEVYRVQNEKGEIYIPKVSVEIYLPNLRKKLYNEGVESLSEEERCILAMFESNRVLAEELSEGDEVLMEFKQLVIEESKGNINEAYNKEWAIREWGKDEGREEGRVEGHAIGLQEGFEQGKNEKQFEMATKMLERNFDSKEISDITGLSIGELEKLRKETYISKCE